MGWAPAARATSFARRKNGHLVYTTARRVYAIGTKTGVWRTPPAAAESAVHERYENGRLAYTPFAALCTNGTRGTRRRRRIGSPVVLYLVRHGRTAQNAARLLLGRMDVPLDDVGRQQAATLGSVPALAAARRVVSSPLARARDTAAMIGPPVSIDDRWIEIDYGVFDGEEVGSTPELWAGWDADIGYRPPGGESILDVGVRVRAACDDLWEEAAVEDIVVVSHVSPIKAAVAWALGVGDDICWRTFLDTASITVVGPGRKGPTLRSFNETAHRPTL